MGNFVVEAWTLLAISWVFILLREYARWSTVGFRGLKPDDFLMVIAGLLYTAETATAHYVGAYWKGLANNSMTSEQRAALDPASLEWHLRVKGSQTQLFGWLVYTVLLWTLKSCWLFFYQRLTDQVANMPIRIKIGAVLVVSTFLATFLTILFGCYPISKHWQINPDPGNFCQPAVSRLQVFTLITLNISTDMYLMSIPLPMVLKAHLPLKRKLTLMVMFSGGLFITVFGILRCVLILTSGPRGPQQAGEWSCRESFTAVVVGNLPMVYPMFHRMIKAGSSYGSSPYPLGSGPQSGNRKYPSIVRGKPKHPLSIPNDTACGSEEMIVLPNKTEVCGMEGHEGYRGHHNDENGKTIISISE